MKNNLSYLSKFEVPSRGKIENAGARAVSPHAAST